LAICRAEKGWEYYLVGVQDSVPGNSDGQGRQIDETRQDFRCSFFTFTFLPLTIKSFTVEEKDLLFIKMVCAKLVDV
jgi:hypothetical protein